ncbi:hypothetical protein CRENBAI_008031 [Crenichthys baileyi]|uniref:Uncharacterized protein n=1 Tax=Crenichthys baileyi TaxID=28760 RepID=A0AAV9R183_9TELE
MTESPFLSCYLPSGLKDHLQETQNICSVHPTTPIAPLKRCTPRDLTVSKLSELHLLPNSASVGNLPPPDEPPSFPNTGTRKLVSVDGRMDGANPGQSWKKTC